MRLGRTSGDDSAFLSVLRFYVWLIGDNGDELRLFLKAQR